MRARRLPAQPLPRMTTRGFGSPDASSDMQRGRPAGPQRATVLCRAARSSSLPAPLSSNRPILGVDCTINVSRGWVHARVVAAVFGQRFAWSSAAAGPSRRVPKANTKHTLHFARFHRQAANHPRLHGGTRGFRTLPLPVPLLSLFINAEHADPHADAALAGVVADCHACARVRTRVRSESRAHECQGRRRHASLRPPPAPRLRCAAAWSK